MAYNYAWTDEGYFDVYDDICFNTVRKDVSIYSLVENRPAIFRCYDDEKAFIDFLELTVPDECIVRYLTRQGFIVDLYSLGNDDVVVVVVDDEIRYALRITLDEMKYRYKKRGATQLR